MIAVSDMMASFFDCILSNLMAYGQNEHWLVPKLYGNYTSSVLQAYVSALFGVTGALYNGILALFYGFTLKYNWEEKRFKTQPCRFWLIQFPFLFAVAYYTTITFTAVKNGDVDTAGDFICTQNEGLVLSAVFLLLSFISIVINMVLLWRFSKKHHTKNMNHHHNNNSEDKTNKSSDKMATIGILYSCSFLFSTGGLILIGFFLIWDLSMVSSLPLSVIHYRDFLLA